MAPELIRRQAERTEKEERSVASAGQATCETSAAKAAVHRQRYLDRLHLIAEQVWRDHCREDER